MNFIPRVLGGALIGAQLSASMFLLLEDKQASVALGLALLLAMGVRLSERRVAARRSGEPELDPADPRDGRAGAWNGRFAESLFALIWQLLTPFTCIYMLLVNADLYGSGCVLAITYVLTVLGHFVRWAAGSAPPA